MIGFPNTTYYPFPTCIVIKFKLNPADPKKFYCGGKPTVLMRYTVIQDYTLQNGPGKVFHTFTNSSLPNHTNCFFNRTNSHLDRNRTDPITIYQVVTSPTAPVKGNNSPKPTPYKPSIFPRWERGTNPKQRRCPRLWRGTNPKPNIFPIRGQGTNPKWTRCQR